MASRTAWTGGFQHLGVLGTFSVLKPGAASEDDQSNLGKLSILTKQPVDLLQAACLSIPGNYYHENPGGGLDNVI